MIKAILYEIVNKINSKRYIGITKTSLKERYNCHLYKLRKNKHNNKIQTDFNIYGESNFYINEIEKGEYNIICLKEKKLIEENFDNLYNIISGGNDKNEKIEALLIYKNKIKNDTNYKEKMQIEIGKKISKIHLGKKRSDETKKRISLANKNKKRSEKVKEEMRKRSIGIKNPNYGKYSLYLNINTGIYYNTKEIQQYFNKTKSGITYLKKKSTLLNNFVKV
jgi:group I intron endonuclease